MADTVNQETQSQPTQETQQNQEQPQTQETQETAQQEQTQDPTAKAAMDLYSSLSDPATAREVVKVLAARTGLKVQEDEISPKAATKQTLESLKDGIPQELHFLVDGLRPAIEKIVNQSIENAVKPVKEAQLQDREQQVMSQIASSYDTLRSRYKDFDKYEGLMNKISEDFAYKPGSDMTKYLDSLYKLATFETKEGRAVKDAVNRINKNASTHINVQSAETSEGTVQTGSKLPSLREAVLAGVKGIKLQ